LARLKSPDATQLAAGSWQLAAGSWRLIMHLLTPLALLNPQVHLINAISRYFPKRNISPLQKLIMF